MADPEVLQLSPEARRRARERAERLGCSVEAYVEKLVFADEITPADPIPVSSVFDLGTSGGSDVAADKERMIATAVV